MIRTAWRRSITFQLWARLSLALVGFAALAYPLYLWIETEESIAQARQEAVSRATVAGGGVANVQRNTNGAGIFPGAGPRAKPATPPSGSGAPDERPLVDELSLIEAYGLLAIERLHTDGTVLERWGDVAGEPEPDIENSGRVVLGNLQGYDAVVSGERYSRSDINPVAVFGGGTFAQVFVVRTAQGPDGTAQVHRIVVDISDVTNEAWALFWRSLMFGGALLVVALVALWLLLRYLVARPLKHYGATAIRIADGENLRMPNLGTNEIGELGDAINSMADTLREQATVDALTGLLNVRHFKDEFPAMLEAARRTGDPLTIANVDVDNLKPVNDSYGHAAGDLVLKSVGSHLHSWGGPDAVHWRVGGDEFVVALHGVGAEQAAAEVEALEDWIADQPLTVHGTTLAISISIGLATYPEDAESMAALVALADQRMYERKARTKAA